MDQGDSLGLTCPIARARRSPPPPAGSLTMRAVDQGLGVALALLGTIVYASTYVLSERLLATTALAAEAVSFYVGAFCSVACMLYMAVFTLPNWHVLVESRCGLADAR